ncbi:uncharacterized protein LACBIDRAFT_303818 [Laccaria bicolor S238N-H82]|uniref:Predicted protein n=1 Tax=Laccaria bicolor (strain S238N-H82 / ATCC MYA-4686) TaxID=486041 RepID=B0DKE2_LACBS|nr:uncharacterized protein LACBIDRAFT_303818 [Laccaria bicolor S238N-H82]EDR04928.1 predicted protein [Laccaria bicolor S238N-H82]|eukprot:XP_001884318.1 predicted protein [Laccaria bicolor S238N-H82]
MSRWAYSLLHTLLIPVFIPSSDSCCRKGAPRSYSSFLSILSVKDAKLSHITKLSSHRSSRKSLPVQNHGV